jgi:hypothetical protein
MLDKSLRILWLVNGLLLFALLLFVGYHAFRQELNSPGFKVDDTEIPSPEELKGIIERSGSHNLAEEKIKDIPGTSILILPVSWQSKGSGEVKQCGERFTLAENDVNSLTNNDVNIIFLDMDYKVINTLLDRRAFIHSTASPLLEDVANTLNSRIRNLVYLISFSDSNHDGALNECDNSDLYISDVDGSNLVQVTNDVLVRNYKFINNNTEILISFRNRGESVETTRFAKYQIARETLVEMSDLREELSKVKNLMQVDSTEQKK